MDEKRVEEWAVKWIGENLDPRRWCYHHLGHVRDVVADAAEFGRLSGLPEPELSLLRAAGWLHDTGYAIDPANHEEASARKAQEVLPQLGCTPEETLRVTGLIRATSLEREPAELAERIMRDADIGRLGTADFVGAALLLRRELAHCGRQFTDLECWQFESGFLGKTEFYTAAARRLRGAGLERNRAWVLNEVARLEREEKA